MMNYFTLLIALVVIGSSAVAQSFTVQVKKPYAFATATVQKHGAVFLTVENQGSSDVEIIAAESDVSERVELHTHTMDDGMMMMREVEMFNVPAQGSHMLEPSGDHIMVMDLKAPLVEGETFDLILKTKDHGDIPVSVDIVAPGFIPQE